MNTPILLITGAVATATATFTSFATNGDDLIGVGPISRAMGGVGVAAPQDAISAVFANPAAMCFTPNCAYSEVNFAGTLFMPQTSARETLGPNTFAADSKQNVYAIPAIGLSVPIDPVTRRWRFGLAAYGVTGLGVDYRGTPIESSQLPGSFSSLMIMKFAPSVSYQALPNLSFGAAFHIDYATLDLGNGSSPTYGFGGQLGVLWQPVPKLSVGLTYITPQSTTFDNVIKYSTGATSYDWRSLELQSPNTVGLGIAYSFFENRLLTEVDGKYLNWGGATGYKDFGWQDQWVVGVGLQFAAIPHKLFVRAGYNYGKNPVRANNGWNPDPNDMTTGHNVQGSYFPPIAYESFRLIGFPAVVEHHLTAGIGYAFSEKFEVNAGYMHAFSNDISEDSAGAYATFQSTLSEDSAEFGITWRF